MRVLYLIDQIYLHGGGERVLSNKTNYFLSSTSHEVFILTSEQKGNKPCYDLNSKVRLDDLGIDYVRDKSYLQPVNFLKIFKHFFKLRRTIYRIKPDIIISLNNQFDSFFLPFIARDIPKVKEYHSSRFMEKDKRDKNKSFIRSLVARLSNYTESKYSCLVVLNKDEVKYCYSDNIKVIPNAISYYPKYKANLNSRIAISAGRIAEVKGYDRLIMIWKLVSKEYPDWRLHVYGEGNLLLRDQLKGLINDLNLSSKIKLCGSTSYLKEKLLDSSIFILTSYTECFPMVLLESFSCGVPCVSFDCPTGPSNIISHNFDGYIVENNNNELLAEKIISLIKNAENRKIMGTYARENVKRFSPEIIMKTWEHLFENLVVNN